MATEVFKNTCTRSSMLKKLSNSFSKMPYELVFSFVLITTMFHLSCSAHYCNLKNCKGKPHTMCKYSESTLGPNCKNPMFSGLTADQKRKILERHNLLRQVVKDGQVYNIKAERLPPVDSTTMMPLEWDEELATIAQRWANQCIYDHDECRDIGPKDIGQVGQNLGIIDGDATADFSDVDIADIVNEWFQEHKIISINEIYSYSGKGIIPEEGRTTEELTIGHFTQLIWGTTKKVGCGAQQFYDPDVNGNSWLLVCNYNPAGNFLNTPVYKFAVSE